MDIALCFYGQPRFIDNHNSYDSYRHHIYSQGDVDVFTHYWFDSNDDKFKTSDWSSNFDNYLHKDTINIIKKLYNPVKSIADKREFLENENVKENVKNLNYFSENNFYNLQSHLYSYEQTFKLLSEHMQQTNKKYDFVVMSRFDLKVTDFPNLSTLDKNKLYINGFGGHTFTDAIFILDSKFINSFNVYSNFEKISNITSIFTSEEYKKNCFLLNNKKEDFSFINLRGGLLRSKNDNIGQF